MKYAACIERVGVDFVGPCYRSPVVAKMDKH